MFVPQRYYIPTARELQRLESVTRSPIYSKFSEALAGVATIRAYRREVYFTAASDALMELNAAAFVSQRAAAGWLSVRLDLLGVVVILLTGAPGWVCGFAGSRPVHDGVAVHAAHDWDGGLLTGGSFSATFSASCVWSGVCVPYKSKMLTRPVAAFLCLPTAVLSISGGISPALAGLCLVYALDMTVRRNWLQQPGTCTLLCLAWGPCMWPCPASSSVRRDTAAGLEVARAQVALL